MELVGKVLRQRREPICRASHDGRYRATPLDSSGQKLDLRASPLCYPYRVVAAQGEWSVPPR
jgi:hypothetical protein